MDFTHDNYAIILDLLIKRGFLFFSLKSYFIDGLQAERSALLRHDVDYNAKNALVFALIEAERGIKATYYFRAPNFRRSFDTKIMKEIEALGHEVGYHYETLDLCKGDFSTAIQLFNLEIEEFRKHGFNVSTICPHGNPRIRKRNYKTNGDILAYDPNLLLRNGLLGDAYKSVDFDNLIYISDVGVRFNSIGVAKDLKRLIQKDPVTKMYFLIHPDYWSQGRCRAFLLWFAGKAMRALKYNAIATSLREMLR
jgi:hypothetical protein